jgi:UDP-N-acetylmuramyl pentapeptide synthase
MHRYTSLQACKGSAKVAVLDTIHGAEVIAQKMVDCGIDARAFEVYHSTPCLEDFDLVVCPVHLGPGNPALSEARRLKKKIITHHQAVGELVKPSIPIFEVTGTHSKTSTALLLSRILSGGRKIVSHTTRGIELWSGGSSRLLQSGLSITPGNVILAAQAAEDDDADALICEVSLGGTGLADYGVLTSFDGDYRIAQGSMWATTAKLQMVSLAKTPSKLIANVNTKISSDVSFGPGGCIRAVPDLLQIGSASVNLELGRDLDFAEYQTAISAATAAGYAAGLSKEEIAEGLEGFDGFIGRMRVERENALTIYDHSNSGLKVSDIARALDRVAGGRLGLVVGEEAATVCEGMDIPRLIDLLRLRRDEIDLLILVGERMFPWAQELGAKTAPDLAGGRSLAKEAREPDRLLLCVKCFR